ncbi:MAG: VWA domain-containing protein [Planctomycetota bacterium]|nr:MAG: VWA domain-containing protein [Planctomycetota bacterium]
MRRPKPTAKVSQVKKLTQAVPLVPKPKVTKPTKGRFSNKADRMPATNQIFGTVKPASKDGADLAKSPFSISEFSLPSASIFPAGIEFFGSFTDERTACYVVDCSGSMQGMFGRVRKELKESIGRLQLDQYFYIIFFGGGRLFESGNGRLLRATKQAKSGAYKFIDSLEPGGGSNALAALERAMQIRGSRNHSPSVIYFLTDGFELATEDEHRFSQKIINLLARFAPGTRINTIGFWPQDTDCELLKMVAKQSGGEFVLVADY